MSSPQSKRFDDFLLKEYENIATAHFESQKQFALFFRYFTLFYSVPFVVFFYNEDKDLITTRQFGWLLVILSIIGIFFFWYAINLKNEAVLYARTVNGIRYHFYRGLRRKVQKKLRTLPIDIHKPSFYSPFNPVLLIITIVNVIVLEYGLNTIGVKNYWCLGLVLAAITSVHFLINFFVSHSQKKVYPSAFNESKFK
jgi:hypothetical protein